MAGVDYFLQESQDAPTTKHVTLEKWTLHQCVRLSNTEVMNIARSWCQRAEIESCQRGDTSICGLNVRDPGVADCLQAICESKQMVGPHLT
jgi:hypothetical protein